MPAHCNYEDCAKTWPRDPVLEVACPRCGAAVGQQCERPSGWSGPFVGPHKARDLKALAEGHYGSCPNDRCPEHLAERPATGDRSERTAPVESTTLDEFG